MNNIEVDFIKLSENATMPQYGREGDAGLDLFTSKDVIIEPKQTIVIPTDIAMSIPFGHEGSVRPRSGNSLNGVKGCYKLYETMTYDHFFFTPIYKEYKIECQPYLRVQLGTIDSNFRGGIGIITYNQEDYKVLIPVGTKLAQLVISPVDYVNLKEVESLEETNRNDNGFGSSDR